MKDEFNPGLAQLREVFEKNLKLTLQEFIFEEIREFSSADWRSAVKALVDDPERRNFPRLGEIKAELKKAASRRRHAEWEETKRRDYQVTLDIMNSERGDDLRELNLNRIKRLLAAIDEGPKAVERLREQLEKEPNCSFAPG